MKTNFNQIVLFSFVLLFLSCNKDDEVNNEPQIANTDVFALGSNIDGKAFYYKNNEKFILESETNENVLPRKIITDGDNVYVSGVLIINTGAPINLLKPGLWKNAKKIELEFDSTNYIFGGIADMVFQDGNLYTLGSIRNIVTNKNEIVIWKNGSINLFASSTTNNYSPTSISVFKNDIYVCGIIQNATGTTNKAFIWKNGFVEFMADNSSSLDVAVNENGIHYLYTTFDPLTADATIKYRKNDEEIAITASTNPSKITLKNNDVYFAGSENAPSGFKACYWKNGEKIALSDSYLALAKELKVDNAGNVFVMQQSYEQFGPLVYWKNNTKFTYGSLNDKMEDFDINNK